MMMVKINTSAPIGAGKCNFAPFKKIMTDRPTNQPTGKPTDRPKFGQEGSLGSCNSDYDNSNTNWLPNKHQFF